MHTVTIAVDLAKNVFELAVANYPEHIRERRRLSRAEFERFWGTRLPCRVVMEACASAHHWARRLLVRGFEVRLLPPQYMRPYVRRAKTDRTDCEALLGRRGDEELRMFSVTSHPVTRRRARRLPLIPTPPCMAGRTPERRIS